MSLGAGSKRRSSGDFEVNIVPIIDCLTILVTFMLASGVYYTVAMLDVTVSTAAGSSGPSDAETNSPVTLAVQAKEDFDLVIKVGGAETLEIPIRRAEKGKWNFASLVKELEKVKEKWPQLKSASLIAEAEVSYQDVVKVLEVTKRVHPDVILGGF